MNILLHITISLKWNIDFKNEYCQYYSKFSCHNYPKCMESHGNLRLKINLPHSMNKVSLLLFNLWPFSLILTFYYTSWSTKTTKATNTMNSITLRNSGFGRIFILPNVFNDKRLFETSFLERQNEHECSRNCFFKQLVKWKLKTRREGVLTIWQKNLVGVSKA